MCGGIWTAVAHLDCSCSVPTMNRTSQLLLTGAHGAVPPAYEVLKEEHEVAVLGAPQSQAPLTTTVINIRSDTAVPDHIVWSLFNTIFMNWCCLGFVAFAYSVKVGGHPGRLHESVCEPGEALPRRHVRGEPPCVRVCVHALSCVCCVCVRVWPGGWFPGRLMARLPGLHGVELGVCVSRTPRRPPSQPHQGRRSLHTQLQNTSLVRKRGRCCKDPDPWCVSGR